MARRIGIFGGTFDPIHCGHLRIAEEVFEALALDVLHVLPSAHPPHRPTPQASAQQRLAMLRLALHNMPQYLVDDRELARSGPSWTIDTLVELRAYYAPTDQLFLLLGWDAFCGLPSWHRWQELLDYAHLVVVARAPLQQPLPEVLQPWMDHKKVEISQCAAPAGNILAVQTTLLAIAASDIRARLAQQRSVRFLVPEAVLDYLYSQQLY